MKRLILFFFSFCICFSCSENPVEMSTENNDDPILSILTKKSEYSWTGNGLQQTKTIKAALVNESGATYYAKLGDGFNSSIDQENLFIAEGSDGYIETNKANDSWKSMPRGILIEEVRYVALRPSREYSLFAFLPWESLETGTFRIRVEFFELINPPDDATPFEAFSNIFEIHQ